jgi:hypothetical protein
VLVLEVSSGKADNDVHALEKTRMNIIFMVAQSVWKTVASKLATIFQHY